MIEIACLEKDLEDFLCKDSNLNKHLGLRFIRRQVATPVGIIDIIGYNKKTKRFVIIELKKDLLDYKSFFQLEKYRHYVEATEYTRCTNKEYRKYTLNIHNDLPRRTFDYLLIGRNISPDLYYSVQLWCNHSDIYLARTWYALFDYRFDKPLSFSYCQPQQKLIEETTYERD